MVLPALQGGRTPAWGARCLPGAPAPAPQQRRQRAGVGEVGPDVHAHEQGEQLRGRTRRTPRPVSTNVAGMLLMRFVSKPVARAAMARSAHKSLPCGNTPRVTTSRRPWSTAACTTIAEPRARTAGTSATPQFPNFPRARTAAGCDRDHCEHRRARDRDPGGLHAEQRAGEEGDHEDRETTEKRNTRESVDLAPSRRPRPRTHRSSDRRRDPSATPARPPPRPQWRWAPPFAARSLRTRAPSPRTPEGL